MLTLISPAKKLDYTAPKAAYGLTTPDGLEQSGNLIKALQKLSVKQIRELMDLSEDLAQLNADRYAAWNMDFNSGQLKQAILAFKGDVYQGMDADSMNATDLDFAQEHLRILSGLHGLLRPLDAIKPYRLEMGTQLKVGTKKNLYAFWGDEVTDRINAQLDALGSDLVINLASAEYFKVVNSKKLKATVITPTFKDYKNGQLKSLFLYVKQARGMMSGFAIRNRITEPDKLKEFNGGGYRFTESLSDELNWVFTR
jgi:cytoplasmic iron level regulating protein YaaA (DUF328/UPF0246 family)